MGQEVCFQIRPLVERAGADRTFVGGRVKMEDFVDRQGSALAEAFSAICAFEGFLL